MAALEWLLDVKVPAKSAARLKADIAAADADDKEGCESIVALHREVQQRDAPARDAVREKVQPAMVAGLRSARQQLSAGWNAVLDLYDAANAPLAAGPPPLTQEITQCYFNLLAFHDSLVTDQEWKPLPADTRGDYTRRLIELYPGMPETAKQWLGNLPIFWTDLYARWAGLAPDDRPAFRQQLLAQLAELKNWPMAELSMQPGQFEPLRWNSTEIVGQQRALDGLIAAVRMQGWGRRA